MPQFRLKAPRLKENDVEQSCIDLLHIRGYMPIRQHSGLFRTPDGRWLRVGEAGIPDFAAIHCKFPGFMFEVKRPGKQPESHQQNKINELRLGYRLAIAVVDSASSLKAWLDQH